MKLKIRKRLFTMIFPILYLSCSLEVGNPTQNPLGDPKTKPVITPDVVATLPSSMSLVSENALIQSQVDLALNLVQQETYFFSQKASNLVSANKTHTESDQNKQFRLAELPCSISADNKTLSFTYKSSSDYSTISLRQGQTISTTNSREISKTATWTSENFNMFSCDSNVPLINISGITSLANLQVQQQYYIIKTSNINTIPTNMQNILAKSTNLSADVSHISSITIQANSTGAEISTAIPINIKEKIDLIKSDGGLLNLTGVTTSTTPLKLIAQLKITKSETPTPSPKDPSPAPETNEPTPYSTPTELPTLTPFLKPNLTNIGYDRDKPWSSLSLQDEPKNWSKQILEGTLVTQLSDGRKIEMNYKNITTDSIDGCIPLRGNITGKVFESDGITLKENFTINFNNSIGDIHYEKSGISDSYIPDCNLLKASSKF